MVIQYKCPSCGADMVFDTKSGTLHCESCGLEQNIADYTEPESSSQDYDGEFDEFTDHTSYNSFHENEAMEYKCNNCGATIITDKDTAATTCSFCGAAMVLSDRLSGELAPNKVIPFKINKQEAQEAFKKWCRNGLLTPKGFMNADRIKNITGMYIPFWMFDVNGRGEVHATCTKVRHYTEGDYDVTETKYYDVYRKVDVEYDHIPCDASEKMDDKLMDKLEPFPSQELKDFKTPYLAGYIAEKYNFTDKQLFPRIKQRADSYVDDYIHSTMHGYSSTSIEHRQIDILQRNAEYALLPIWIVCYDYNHSDHMFAMNGQTGKVVGKPPLSKGKIAAWFGGISAASFLILQIISFFTGGGF